MGIQWARPQAPEVEPVVPKDIVLDSKVMYASLGRLIREFDAETGTGMRVLRGHQNRIRYMCVSPDGTMLASHSDENSPDSSVLWDAKTAELLHTFEWNQERIERMTFSNDSSRLIFVINWNYSRFWLWDIASRLFLWSVAITDPCDYMHCSCFSPDVSFFAFRQLDKIAIWQIAGGDRDGISHAITIDETVPAQTICFSPDRTLLAAHADCRPSMIFIWRLDIDVPNVGTSSTIRSVQRHQQFRLGYGSRNSHSALLFNKSSSILIVGAINSITLWDVSTGTPLLAKDYFNYVSAIICLSSAVDDNIPHGQQILSVNFYSLQDRRQYVEYVEIDCVRKEWVCFKRIAIGEVDEDEDQGMLCLCFQSGTTESLSTLLK